MGRIRKPADEVLEMRAEGPENLDVEMDSDLDANEIVEDDDDVPDAKQKRRGAGRKPAARKKKEPAGPVAQLFEAASKPRDEESEDDAEEENEAPEAEEEDSQEVAKAPASKPDASPAAEEKKPAAPRRPRATAEEKALSGAMETAMQSMVRHWTAVQEISQATAGNLEKVTKVVQELPAKYEERLEAMFKAPPPKPSTVTKVAAAMSAVSFVLSLLSISLAQSVRSQALSGSFARAGSSVAIHESAVNPMAALAPTSQPVTKEVARAPRVEPRRALRHSEPSTAHPPMIMRSVKHHQH